jgi:DNA topoisomerase-1
MPLDCALEPPVFAEAAGLSYVNDHDPGIRRVANGKGFIYRNPSGGLIRQPQTLQRIQALAIPPAYTDVWICSDPLGHIQATGRDQRGRKQYRYHPLWREQRDQTKYGRMAAFGRALPYLRTAVDADLARRGLPRDKVLAAVVRLLEITLIRVGNDEYARQNKSFGLTTLRKRHVDISGAGVTFEFRGKSGKVHRTGFRDRRLARIVGSCQHLPGQRLFQYLDEDGRRHAVESADVNAYIRRATEENFSAKDFRTWAATLGAAAILTPAEIPKSQAEAKRVLADCVRTVSRRLGNTPAVCRASYIHPGLLEAYASGVLHQTFASTGDQPTEVLESALLDFLGRLEDMPRRDANVK